MKYLWTHSGRQRDVPYPRLACKSTHHCTRQLQDRHNCNATRQRTFCSMPYTTLWIPSQLPSHPCFVTACTLLFWFWFSSVTVVDMLTFAGVTPCSQVFNIGGCPRLSSKGFQHTLDGHEGVLRLAQWGAESRQYSEVSRLVRGPEPQQGLCGIQLLKAFRTVAEVVNQRVSVCIVMLWSLCSQQSRKHSHIREKTQS